MKQHRHYCTYCHSKKNESKMFKFWYPLLRKYGWHCIDCLEKYQIFPYKMSTSEDI